MELPQNTIELPLVLVGWKSLRFTHISVRYISNQTHSRVYAVTVYVHTYHNTNHTNPYPNTHTLIHIVAQNGRAKQTPSEG